MKKQLKKQNGMTMISMVVVIAVVLFFIVVGLKMVPTYMEDYSIGQVLTSMQDDSRTRSMSARELKTTMLKRFRINSVYSFNKNNLIIKKAQNGYDVNIDYIINKPIAGNVSVSMAFKHNAEFRR